MVSLTWPCPIQQIQQAIEVLRDPDNRQKLDKDLGYYTPREPAWINELFGEDYTGWRPSNCSLYNLRNGLDRYMYSYGNSVHMNPHSKDSAEERAWHENERAMNEEVRQWNMEREERRKQAMRERVRCDEKEMAVAGEESDDNLGESDVHWENGNTYQEWPVEEDGQVPMAAASHDSVDDDLDVPDFPLVDEDIDNTVEREHDAEDNQSLPGLSPNEEEPENLDQNHDALKNEEYDINLPQHVKLERSSHRKSNKSNFNYSVAIDDEDEAMSDFLESEEDGSSSEDENGIMHTQGAALAEEEDDGCESISDFLDAEEFESTHQSEYNYGDDSDSGAYIRDYGDDLASLQREYGTHLENENGSDVFYDSKEAESEIHSVSSSFYNLTGVKDHQSPNNEGNGPLSAFIPYFKRKLSHDSGRYTAQDLDLELKGVMMECFRGWLETLRLTMPHSQPLETGYDPKNCSHLGLWVKEFGHPECDVCGRWMPISMLRCPGCGIRACISCKLRGEETF